MTNGTKTDKLSEIDIYRLANRKGNIKREREKKGEGETMVEMNTILRPLKIE